MSFGFSPADIVALVNITSKAYQGWKHACGEYSEVTGSLDSLLIVLGRIQTEALKRESVLLRTSTDHRDLKVIFSSCEPTVRELHSVVVRFKSLGSSREKNWDKLRFGVKNLDPLRTKLNQHIGAITAYLDAVGLGALGRIERDLNAIPDRIQKTIDALAAEIRAGRREGSILTTYSDDEKEVWKQFRRELVGDGIKSSSIHKYKPLIRKYLKELAEKGELEELPPGDERQAQQMILDHAPAIDRFLRSTELNEKLPGIHESPTRSAESSAEAEEQRREPAVPQIAEVNNSKDEQAPAATTETDVESTGPFLASDGEDMSTYDFTKGQIKKYKRGKETIWQYPHKIKHQYADGRISNTKRLAYYLTKDLSSENSDGNLQDDTKNDTQKQDPAKTSLALVPTPPSIQMPETRKTRRTHLTPHQQEEFDRRRSSSFSRGHPPITPRKPMPSETQSDTETLPVPSDHESELSDTMATSGRTRRRRQRVYYAEPTRRRETVKQVAAGMALIGAFAALAGRDRRKQRDALQENDYSD